jgi:hypothetical protein
LVNFPLSQPPNILTAKPAESATDLIRSGSSKNLKNAGEKNLSFGPLGREALSNFIKFPSAASRSQCSASRRLKLNGSGVAVVRCKLINQIITHNAEL